MTTTYLVKLFVMFYKLNISGCKSDKFGLIINKIRLVDFILWHKLRKTWFLKKNLPGDWYKHKDNI